MVHMDGVLLGDLCGSLRGCDVGRSENYEHEGCHRQIFRNAPGTCKEDVYTQNVQEKWTREIITTFPGILPSISSKRLKQKVEIMPEVHGWEVRAEGLTCASL